MIHSPKPFIVRHGLRLQILTCCLALSWTVLGCGAPADQPDLGTVTGIVTLGGDPLPDARVVFDPADGGRSSEAVTDEKGFYELSYSGEEMGAKVGQHKVYVSTYEEAEPDDSGKMVGGREEQVPEKYNTKSELVKEVKPGSNDIPLTLEK